MKKPSRLILLCRIFLNQTFYDTSGGGVTVSGGEPLLQVDFCVELFKNLKKRSIHCALDTCGNVTWDSFEKILPFTIYFYMT